MGDTQTRNCRQTYTSDRRTDPVPPAPPVPRGQKVWQTRRWQADVGEGEGGYGWGPSRAASRTSPEGLYRGLGEAGQGWPVGLWPRGRGAGPAARGRGLARCGVPWSWSQGRQVGGAHPPAAHPSSQLGLLHPGPRALNTRPCSRTGPGARPSPRPRHVATPTYIQRRLRHVRCSLRSGLTL